MVAVKDELETHLSRVALDYRRLWLDEAERLGLVAEYLAEVLAWKPTDEQLLPDALALAERAAQRIRELETSLAGATPRWQPQPSALHKLTYVLN